MKQKIESIAIGIAVKDVKEATRWYTSLLGDVEMIEPAPGTIELQLTDDAWLQLDDTGYLTTGGNGAIIRLETKNIEGMHEKVRKLTPDTGDIELVEGVIRFFDFEDPSGNRLSFYELIK